MVETEEAVAVVDEIAAVEGLDAIFVGPRDLALSGPLVAGGEREHEEELMERILLACKAAGVVAGIACETDESVKKWFTAGVRMFGLRSDIRLLTEAAAALRYETSRSVQRAD
jgi:4-hydroxy-2-oxoheptanedioate aldolase